MKNLIYDLVIYKLNQFTNEIKNLQIKKTNLQMKKNFLARFIFIFN